MPTTKVLTYKNNRFLFIDGDLWMWDTPRERELQRLIGRQAYGEVLVAGYGFGLIVQYLLKNKRVKSVVVAEKYSEVMRAVQKIDKIYGDIKIIDFYKFPETMKYDCVIGDIWQDIDPLFLKDYERFKKKASRLLKKDGKIFAWGEEYYEYLLKISNKRPN